jgi:hypothetical protein
MNNLSGRIPESMSALSSLEVLNVSYNHLSGIIPTGTQLQTLSDPSIYMGNPYLWGPPLETSCSTAGSSLDANINTNSTSKNSGPDENLWFYLFIEFGFVIGFLVVIVTLLFKISWSYAYFQLIDSEFDELCESEALILNKLWNE